MVKEVRELERLQRYVADDLLAFFKSKQRIADAANDDVLINDGVEPAIAYSTFHRALDRNEVHPHVVNVLEGVHQEAISDPRKFLPARGDDLRTWMKGIEKAQWWFDAFDLASLEIGFGAFKNWMAGTQGIKQAKVDAMVERIDPWWQRVLEVVEQVEQVRDAKARVRRMDDADRRAVPAVDTTDTYLRRRIVEDGEDAAQVRAEFVEMQWRALATVDIIDLLNPRDVRRWSYYDENEDERREGFGRWFDDIVANGYPNAVPTLPPADFVEHERWSEPRQWGDRRQEECVEDLNEELYNLWHRHLSRVTWNRDYAMPGGEVIRSEVSTDGVNWREATEREKRGWDSGSRINAKWRWESGLQSVVNSYDRERALIRRSIGDLEMKIMSAQWQSTDKATVRSWERQVDELYREYANVRTT